MAFIFSLNAWIVKLLSDPSARGLSAVMGVTDSMSTAMPGDFSWILLTKVTKSWDTLSTPEAIQFMPSIK